jgi:hypothetical protein
MGAHLSLIAISNILSLILTLSPTYLSKASIISLTRCWFREAYTNCSIRGHFTGSVCEQLKAVARPC